MPPRNPSRSSDSIAGARDRLAIIAESDVGHLLEPATAVELLDASQLIRAGDVTSAVGGAGRQAALRDAYDVAIVPDGVARVRWTFANRSGGPGQVMAASVSKNVAITHLRSSTAFLLRATWYAADGSEVPTSDAALAAAKAARTNAERWHALRQAEQQHATAPASLLDAFAVFSFNSPTGTKTSSRYIISHPPLSALPLSILRLSTHRLAQLDLRQARHVIAPSGRDMWAIPGTQGLCVWATDQFTPPYGPVSNGAGGSCSSSVQQAESEGSGFSSTESNGSIVYGIVPKATHSVTIQTGPHTHRTIHAADGVYIATTPFRFG